MSNDKQFTSHLCTFMGREANLKILIPYIDSALKIGAVDNYWFIDMTRKRSDHELIKKLSAELNDKYPGRVHLYNSEERGRIIDDKDKLAEATKSWETFYKFLNRFNDNDIIAKCDDDTYYIDVETLKAAYEFRWENKKPYLMHANAINNGLTAYQMNKKGIFNDKESSLYPTGGLTGPLFSHPEIACKHHEQFTRDMLGNHDNINKYKLGKNIQFCNRVSINFIFMLGKDRHELSKITYQDEYDTSCKYPQRENRPNVIIGDFTMAHHTYGVQEPIMEKLQTHVGYEKLCEKLNSGDVEFENKTIGTQLNATTTVVAKGKYLMRAWVERNSYAIRHVESGRFLQLLNVPEGDGGRHFNKSWLRRGDTDIKKACIFNIDDINKPGVIRLNNSTSILSTKTNNNDTAAAFPVPAFFQASYTKNNVVLKKTNSNKYTIHPQNAPEYALFTPNAHPNLHKTQKDKAMEIETMLQWNKKIKTQEWEAETKTEWELIPVSKHNDTIIAGVIDRPRSFTQYANDMTFSRCFIDDLPDNHCPREWIWMVKDYIWEMVPTPKENIFKIKLVADDRPDMYLFYQQGQDKLITGGGGDEFEFIDKAPKFLKHVKTGKYVNITDDGQVVLQPNLAELAMCPLR